MGERKTSTGFPPGTMSPDDFRRDQVEKGLLSTDWKHAMYNPEITGWDMYEDYLKSINGEGRKYNKEPYPKKLSPQWGDEGDERPVAALAWGIWGDWHAYVSYIEAKKAFFKEKVNGGRNRRSNPKPSEFKQEYQADWLNTNAETQAFRARRAARERGDE